LLRQISEKISLAPLLISDAPTIFNLVEHSRDILQQYLYWVSTVTDISTTEQYIATRINSGLPDAQWYKVYFEQEISGIFAIKSIDKQSQVAELGYWLSTAVQGNGIIDQIIQALPRILESTPAKIIEFRCLTMNFAIIGVAQKAGAVLVDCLPKFMEANNKMQDLNIYQVALKDIK